MKKTNTPHPRVIREPGQPKTYRVQFVEWVLYEDIIEAGSAEEAIDLVDRKVAENGVDDLRIRDNGFEEFTATLES